MSSERKMNKLVPNKVKKDDIMAIVYFVKVKDSQKQGEHLIVSDLDQDQGDIHVTGRSLVENSFSADQHQEIQKVNKTTAAQFLVQSYNRPFTVCYEKDNGEERILRGRLIKEDPLMGRSIVEDLEAADRNDRVRQVNHRTIKWLVVDGTKYEVKGK